MKRIFATLCFILVSAWAIAQNTLSLATEHLHEQFWVSVNGVLQTTIPVQNICLFGLAEGFHQVQITLNSPKRTKINAKIFVRRGSNNFYITRYTPRKNKYFLREVNYDLLTTTQLPLRIESGYGPRPHHGGGQPLPPPPAGAPNHHTSHPTSHTCSPACFTQAKKLVEGENFDDDRLAVAKHVIQHSSMSAQQISEIASLLNFEKNKLELLKYAYPFCRDKMNYFLVENVLNFKSSKDELREFILKADY